MSLQDNSTTLHNKLYTCATKHLIRKVCSTPVKFHEVTLFFLSLPITIYIENLSHKYASKTFVTIFLKKPDPIASNFLLLFLNLLRFLVSEEQFIIFSLPQVNVKANNVPLGKLKEHNYEQLVRVTIIKNPGLNPLHSKV